jgi:hypothetical protein
VTKAVWGEEEAQGEAGMRILKLTQASSCLIHEGKEKINKH